MGWIRGIMGGIFGMIWLLWTDLRVVAMAATQWVFMPQLSTVCPLPTAGGKNDLSTVELNLAIQNGLEVDISHVLGAHSSPVSSTCAD